jgi:hypothetical protein
MQYRVIRIIVSGESIEVTFASGETLSAALHLLAQRGEPYEDFADTAFAAQALILDEGLLVKWPSGFSLTAVELYELLKTGGNTTLRMF